MIAAVFRHTPIPTADAIPEIDLIIEEDRTLCAVEECEAFASMWHAFDLAENLPGVSLAVVAFPLCERHDAIAVMDMIECGEIEE